MEDVLAFQISDIDRVVNWNGLGIGALFGSLLLLGGLAEPDKIVGTLRFKDFHALRVILLFLVVGMLGVWFLEALGVANLSIKPTTTFTVLLGGSIMGIGFGLTGYCPGTGLACSAAGRLDAMITVLGMFVGAFVYILIYPWAVMGLENIANAGKVTLPEATGIPKFVWAVCLTGAGIVILILTAKEPAKK